MEQESVKQEAAAEKLLCAARKKEDCVGGRIFAAGRGRDRKFVVQMFYQDDGGSPPVGRARYMIPPSTATEIGL